MYAGTEFKHGYDFITDGGGIDKHERSLKSSGIDFLALYRKNAAGQYLEFGGVYSIISEHTIADSNVAFDNSRDWVDDNRIGAVLGFGSNIAGGGMSLLSLGLRLRYDFTDLWMTESDANGFFNSNRDQANTTPAYPEYKATSPASVMLILEYNLGLGHFAQRSCPKRVKYFNYD